MIDEVQIINEVLKGNTKAFEQIIHRYKDFIFNLGINFFSNYQDAEDFTQEVFIKIYRNLKNFNFQSNFKTWLYKVAINTAKDFLRKRKIVTSSIEDFENSIYTEEKFEDEIQKDMEAEKILSIIRTLPQKYSTVLILRYVDNLSYEEIAKVISKPVGTVKTLLFRAKLLLMEKLKITL